MLRRPSRSGLCGSPSRSANAWCLRWQATHSLVTIAVDFYLFGYFVGPVVWLVQMLWIPFWAAGIINGVGHALGYRNFEVKDESRNISPIAIWLGGEELHNNHHADPKSARFAAKWYEFDVGWFYIRLLQLLRLAKVEYARGGAAARGAAHNLTALR